MSFCIGLLLPANTPDAVLKTLAEKYITEEDWYQLTEIHEPHMTEGLEGERLFFVPHPQGGMDNSYTGIGSRPLLHMPFPKNLGLPLWRELEWRREFSQRKQRCRKDVKLWAKAIRYLMKEVRSVGVFTFMCEEDPRCWEYPSAEYPLDGLLEKHLIDLEVYHVVRFRKNK